MTTATATLATVPAATTAEALLASATRKTLVRLIPILAIAYFFNYIDRTNVGFAALTMNRDLGLTNAQFGAAAGLFFVGYCLLEVPSNLILYRVGARRWLARIMISWGLLSAATALVTGPTSFYVLRILTGAAEAGFFPGVLFYLSTWFPAQSRVRVLSWFLVAIPLSSVVGGPLSVGLLQLDGLLGWKGWQWLFVVEGLPACIMGVLTLMFLRDTPKEATWLTTEERGALIEALERESTSRPRKDFLAALRDGKVWLLTGILFSYWLGINGIAIWLPLILKGHGLSTVAIGWLSAVPYLVASVAMIVWARYMDRTGRHLANLAATCLVASAGFVISVMFGSLIPAMIGITFAVIGLSSARPAFYSLPSRYLAGAAAAGGIAFINAVGSLSGYVAPWIMGVLKGATGSFNAGLLGLAAMLVVSASLTGVLSLVTRER
ncbi:MFS transporter [Methylobacterium aquaticum]|uniref:Membrane protein n=1 Tax=Methylobacterium aquaticum TaxID=270351 RepID=A0A0J6SIW6_9HYPH|nr:MFS transporter [Methylobacterium aquaticum]KMO33544.1 membrane protein [Methylobacterium aquaticum]